jgi:hypothetical protein
MKQSILCLLVMVMVVSLVNCTQEDHKPRVLAKINNYELTLDEFNSRLKTELELAPDFKQSWEGKHAFLEELIRKELLIQTAKKLELDRREEFIKAMERYWESTLIRDLLELKSDEIDASVKVSQSEIEDLYQEMKQKTPQVPPIKEIQTELRDEIKERKKTVLLEEWINNLRKKSNIQIHEELL